MEQYLIKAFHFLSNPTTCSELVDVLVFETSNHIMILSRHDWSYTFNYQLLQMNSYVEMGNALDMFYKPAILLMKLEYPTRLFLHKLVNFSVTRTFTLNYWMIDLGVLFISMLKSFWYYYEWKIPVKWHARNLSLDNFPSLIILCTSRYLQMSSI